PGAGGDRPAHLHRGSSVSRCPGHGGGAPIAPAALVLAPHVSPGGDAPASRAGFGRLVPDACQLYGRELVWRKHHSPAPILRSGPGSAGQRPPPVPGTGVRTVQHFGPAAVGPSAGAAAAI